MPADCDPSKQGGFFLLPSLRVHLPPLPSPNVFQNHAILVNWEQLVNAVWLVTLILLMVTASQPYWPSTWPHADTPSCSIFLASLCVQFQRPFATLCWLNPVIRATLVACCDYCKGARMDSWA